MTMNEKSEKNELRRLMKEKRELLPSATIKAHSAAVIGQLKGEKIFFEAENILLYASLSHEVQLWDLAEECLARGVKVYFPLIEGKGIMRAARIFSLSDLKPDKYGILSPRADFPVAPPKDINLIVAPGLAFSPSGERLGMGGGYYDRFLPQAARAYVAALAFDFQIVEDLPVEPHDVLMDLIITPTRKILCSRRRSAP